jgi:hypothetical protein
MQEPSMPDRPRAASKRLSKAAQRPIIGWREWVGLPDLGVQKIKAKIDTGARSSALHAFNVEPFRRRGEDWVHFEIHPLQRNNTRIVRAKARVADQRHVRSSNGMREARYIIRTTLLLGRETWEAEISLTNRDEMGFRMLIGRSALRKRFVIWPDASFRAGAPMPPSSR